MAGIRETRFHFLIHCRVAHGSHHGGFSLLEATTGHPEHHVNTDPEHTARALLMTEHAWPTSALFLQVPGLFRLNVIPLELYRLTSCIAPNPIYLNER